MNFLLESGVKSVDEAYGFLNLSPLYSKYGTKTIVCMSISGSIFRLA
jgi:hypothetical protein